MNSLIEKSAQLYFHNPVRSAYGLVSPYTSYGYYLAKNFFPRVSYYQRHEPAYVSKQTKYRAVPLVLAGLFMLAGQVSLAKQVKATRQRRLVESQ